MMAPRLTGGLRAWAAHLALLALGAAGWAGAADHVVVIEAMQFSPRDLEVRQGDTIEWVNKDPFPHDVTTVGKTLRSGPIAPEGRWKTKLSRAGEFSYRCTLHPMMQGRVSVVGAARTSNQRRAPLQ
jgi:plastocyanin